MVNFIVLGTRQTIFSPGMRSRVAVPILKLPDQANLDFNMGDLTWTAA